MLGRVLLGDDARACLDGAPCAIAIVPHRYTESPTPLDEIGVGYDGSPESERALSAARELADRAGARIKVLWVVSPRDVREKKPMSADSSEAALRLVAERSERLGDLDRIGGEAVYGQPTEGLCRFSGELDLLVLGSTAQRSLGRRVNGSVSRYLVGHALCPLLVLTRNAGVAGSVARAA